MHSFFLSLFKYIKIERNTSFVCLVQYVKKLICTLFTEQLCKIYRILHHEINVQTLFFLCSQRTLIFVQHVFHQQIRNSHQSELNNSIVCIVLRYSMFEGFIGGPGFFVFVVKEPGCFCVQLFHLFIAVELHQFSNMAQYTVNLRKIMCSFKTGFQMIQRMYSISF